MVAVVRAVREAVGPEILVAMDATGSSTSTT